MAIMAALLPDFLPDTLVALFTGIGLGAAGVTWFYKEMRVKPLSEQSQRDREEILYLKKRIGDLPNNTQLSLASNLELKNKTRHLVERIKKYLKKRIRLETEYNAATDILSKAEREESEGMKQLQNIVEALHLQIDQDEKYNETFRYEAILLKKELIERVPPEHHGANISVYEFLLDKYKFRGAASQIDKIVLDLECLANSLNVGRHSLNLLDLFLHRILATRERHN
jgi:hypothetical protein